MTTYGLDGKPVVRPDAKPQTPAQKKAAAQRIEAAKKRQGKLDQVARMRAKGIYI